MIKKKFRICKNSIFQEIISSSNTENTNKIVENEFILYFKRNKLDHFRVGISVFSKVKNAVLRNKIKRQVRSMIANLIDFHKNFDMVIVIKKNFIKNSYQQNFSLIKKKINLCF